MERVTTWERLRRVNPLVWDGLLAVAVFVGSLLGGSSFYSTPGHRYVILSLGSTEVAFNGGGRGAALVLAAACIPLVWRRRAPIGVLAVTAVAVGVYQFAGFREGAVSLALAVAAYTAAAHRERTTVLAVALPIALTAGLTLLLVGDQGDGRSRLEFLFLLMISVGLPILFGRIAFNRRRRIQRDRERAARDAVAEERTRIARELHDVVAHALGVMVVQAGAARVVIDRDSTKATAALRRIEETGRTGLTEMRRLLGILETEDEEVALGPQPGLERLDDLLETMRGTGLPVEALVEGVPRDLPPGIDLAAYRVIQEALTNALKHAGEAHARVLLRYGDDALELEIADDGPGPPPNGTQPAGRGLIGMRERVSLFGGTVETVGRPGGGFVVRAKIPLASET